MIKKNQFALIFLTVITMLAVWYIKSPIGSEQETETPVTGNVTTGRLAVLTQMRDALRNERSTEVLSYDAILADSEATVTNKQDALEAKQSLSDLTEKEILLELEIINSGYQDAFVHATNDGIEVLVIAPENNYTNANEIILMTLLSFESTNQNAVVTFKTVDEVIN